MKMNSPASDSLNAFRARLIWLNQKRWNFNKYLQTQGAQLSAKIIFQSQQMQSSPWDFYAVPDVA